MYTQMKTIAMQAAGSWLWEITEVKSNFQHERKHKYVILY